MCLEFRARSSRGHPRCSLLVRYQVSSPFMPRPRGLADRRVQKEREAIKDFLDGSVLLDRMVTWDREERLVKRGLWDPSAELVSRVFQGHVGPKAHRAKALKDQ